MRIHRLIRRDAAETRPQSAGTLDYERGKHLLEDVAQLKVETGEPVGWVAARCDAARPVQNVRSNPF